MDPNQPTRTVDPRPHPPTIRQAMRDATAHGRANLDAIVKGETPPPPGQTPPQPAPPIQPEPPPMAPAAPPAAPPAGMAPNQPPAPQPVQPQQPPAPQPQAPPQPAPGQQPAPSAPGESGAEPQTIQPSGEFEEIAIPEHLHQHGFQSLSVPKENAPALQALVASAMSGVDVQTERVQLQQQQQAYNQKFESAMTALYADPMGTHVRAAQQMGITPEEAEGDLQLYFLKDPAAFDRMKALLEEVSESAAQMRAAVAEREGRLLTRQQKAAQRVAYQRGEDEWTRRTEQMVWNELQQVPEERRQFAFKNIAQHVDAWMRQRGYAAIMDAEIMQLVGQWTGLFPAAGNPETVQGRQRAPAAAGGNSARGRCR